MPRTLHTRRFLRAAAPALALAASLAAFLATGLVAAPARAADDVAALPPPPTGCSSDPTLPVTEITVDGLPKLVEGSEGCVLLLELYASWCAPCTRIAPEVASLHQKYGDKGLLIRGVSADTNREALETWLGNHGGIYAPLVLDTWTLDALETTYAGMGAEFKKAIPFFVLFDRQGQLLATMTEPKDLEAIEIKIREAL
jgi:thiol-disulfide isomerase/thioredoxin